MIEVGNHPGALLAIGKEIPKLRQQAPHSNRSESRGRYTAELVSPEPPYSRATVGHRRNVDCRSGFGGELLAIARDSRNLG